MSSSAPVDENLVTRPASEIGLVAVLGLGYAGLPLALSIAEKGVLVIGIDQDRRIVDSLNFGESPFRHIPSERVSRLTKSGRFAACYDYARIGEADAVMICAPTPLDLDGAPDLSCLSAMVTSAAPRLRKGALVSVESTTYPGATREVVGGILRKHGHTPGEDVFLAHSPEREDPGNSRYSLATTPKIVGGLTQACGDAAEALYRAVAVDIHRVSTPEISEAAKLLENMFRAVNIGFINEIKVVLDRMEINVWEVMDAAATKPFGFMTFSPGPGLGGHCIPVDPRYFSWKARQVGASCEVLECALAASFAMPEYVVTQVEKGLADRKVEMSDAKVLVLGVTYKANVPDTRESPALEIMKLLAARGTRVSWHDPWVNAHLEGSDYQRLHDLDVSAVISSDCIVLATDHASFDYALIAEKAKFIVDPRGSFTKKLRRTH